MFCWNSSLGVCCAVLCSKLSLQLSATPELIKTRWCFCVVPSDGILLDIVTCPDHYLATGLSESVGHDEVD